MKRILFFFGVVIMAGCHTQPAKLTDYVDVFIGTSGHGHTFPGAVLPFGMVQLSPDNEKLGWDWCSGYHESDSIIIGFSHTHLSGTGCGDMQDVLLMPAVKSLATDTSKAGSDFIYQYKSSYSHVNEKAQPGYYSVVLDDSKIKVELTASLRTGFHRYTFPKSANSKIIIDLQGKRGTNKSVKTSIQIQDSVTVVGYTYSKGWAEYRKVYFTAKFSQPFKKFYTSSKGELNEGVAIDTSRSSKAILCFDTRENELVLTKVGISSTSIENAMSNLNAEIPAWNFDEVVSMASQEWERTLSKYTVESKDENLKKIFYTALYHSNIHPSLYSDVDGSYTGPDGQIHQSSNSRNFYTFSLWDTFRALHPLITLTDEGLVNEFVKAMLLHYNEFGLLPVWSLWGNETYCMIGYHSVPVIVDAYFKGIRGFDVNLAYQAMKNSAMGIGTNNHKYDFKLVDQYIKYGYLPMDVIIEYNKKNNLGNYYESAARTLEWAFDDWCIAQLAKALGKDSDYTYFMNRGENFKNVADSTIGFIRTRNKDGKWVTPFDPAYAAPEYGFVEGNSWQYSWFVPQNIPALITFMGGEEKFVQRLDSLFTVKADPAKIHFPDVSGLIGMYAHGNEPSHHVAYLYNYARQPWKTQKAVALVRDSLYTSNQNGLCGNDDCGQMSAWYVFSAMGFYPVNPAIGIYAIGTPAFEKLTVKSAKGNNFTILAHNISKANIYIQSAKLNGQSYEKFYIKHSDILKGGTLEFEMGSTPNQKWAVNAD